MVTNLTVFVFTTHRTTKSMKPLTEIIIGSKYAPVKKLQKKQLNNMTTADVKSTISFENAMVFNNFNFSHTTPIYTKLQSILLMLLLTFESYAYLIVSTVLC